MFISNITAPRARWRSYGVLPLSKSRVPLQINNGKVAKQLVSAVKMEVSARHIKIPPGL